MKKITRCMEVQKFMNSDGDVRYLAVNAIPYEVSECYNKGFTFQGIVVVKCEMDSSTFIKNSNITEKEN